MLGRVKKVAIQALVSKNSFQDNVPDQGVKQTRSWVKNKPIKEEAYDLVDQLIQQKFISESFDHKTYKSVQQNDLYYFEDTNFSSEGRILEEKGFLAGVVHAYNNHGDLFLSPDDIWLVILFSISKYIDKNAEKLRDQFVMHEGTKKLTVVDEAGSVEESVDMETDWCHFFPQILHQIRANTLPGVVEKFECNFSTTTSLHRIISTAAIMYSFKKYFKYGRIIMMCGIANVFFEGLRSDWELLIQKLEAFAMYDVDGWLTEYIQRNRIVLQKLLETFDGQVDVAWWNTILTTEEFRIGSGSDIQTNGQGWLLHLYGIYGMVDLYDVPDLHLSVPVELENKLTSIKTNLTMHVGSFSLSRYGEYAYRPDFCVCLVSDEFTPDQFGPRGPTALKKYHQRKEQRQIATKQLFLADMSVAENVFEFAMPTTSTAKKVVLPAEVV